MISSAVLYFLWAAARGVGRRVVSDRQHGVVRDYSPCRGRHICRADSASLLEFQKVCFWQCAGEKDLYLLPGFLPRDPGIHRVVLGPAGRT